MGKTNKFHVDFKNYSIVGDIMGDKSDVTVLFLHGAGASTRNGYETIRRMLYEKGISSCAFDFIGHGETGGELSKSSLYERTEQACRVIEHIKNDRSLSVVGASMSGYTSVKLLQLYDIKSVVLFVPAAYDKDAYKLPFNAGFTECIRREGSYMKSDAYEILRNYNGGIMIVNAGQDTVIPHGVIEKYRESSVNAKVKKFITLKDSPHKILSYMEENEGRLKNVIDAMAEIVG